MTHAIIVYNMYMSIYIYPHIDDYIKKTKQTNLHKNYPSEKKKNINCS